MVVYGVITPFQQEENDGSVGTNIAIDTVTVDGKVVTPLTGLQYISSQQPALNMMLFDAEATEQSFFQLLAENIEGWASKGWKAFIAAVLSGLLWVLVMRLLTKWFIYVLRKVFAKSKGVNNLMANFICKMVDILACKRRANFHNRRKKASERVCRGRAQKLYCAKK